MNNITVNLESKLVKQGRKVVPVSPVEFSLLTHMALTPGKVYQREELAFAVGIVAGDGGRNVDQWVSRLRKKLGAGAIRTATGFGYAVDEATVLGRL